MSISSTIANDERSKNAGSVMPDAIEMMTALEKVFRYLKSPNLITAWLYLWLTHQLNQSEKTITTLVLPIRVAADKRADKSQIRTFYDGSISWIEYSLPYFDPKTKQSGYFWQPVPTSLNALFHQVVSTLPWNKPLLTEQEMIKLYRVINQKQRANPKIRAAKAVRKDILHRYPAKALSTYPSLDNLSKSIVLPNLHHDSARYYLSAWISQIRRALFDASNDILDRIWHAAETQQCLNYFTVQIRNNHNKIIPQHVISIAYSKQAKRTYEAKYLNLESNRICEYTRDANTECVTELPDVLIAHKRSITGLKVQQLFTQLHHNLNALKSNARTSKTKHIHYYNDLTCTVALEFIALTSARPTHGIFPMREHYSLGLTVIKDKGKWREIYICDYLARRLDDYLTQQNRLLKHVNISLTERPPQLGFLVSPNGRTRSLCATDLRHFLEQNSPFPMEAYQLRHYFAQFALMEATSKLPPWLLDHCMGHSQYGEGLAFTSLLPTHHESIQTHLNILVQQLGLEKNL